MNCKNLLKASGDRKTYYLLHKVIQLIFSSTQSSRKFSGGSEDGKFKKMLRKRESLVRERAIEKNRTSNNKREKIKRASENV